MTQTVSTINPLNPVLGSALTSTPVRDNFVSAYNDINYILNALSGGTGGGGYTAANVTSSTSISALATGTFYTNSGASGTVNLTLPAAVIGLTFGIFVATAQTFAFVAHGSETIRNADAVTSSGGSFSSSTIGNIIELICVINGQWIARQITGEWTYA